MLGNKIQNYNSSQKSGLCLSFFLTTFKAFKTIFWLGYKGEFCEGGLVYIISWLLWSPYKKKDYNYGKVPMDNKGRIYKLVNVAPNINYQ